MARTAKRPLVTGALSPRAALTFAIGLEALAFIELWALVNLLSAVLAVSVAVLGQSSSLLVAMLAMGAAAVGSLLTASGAEEVRR